MSGLFSHPKMPAVAATPQVGSSQGAAEISAQDDVRLKVAAAKKKNQTLFGGANDLQPSLAQPAVGGGAALKPLLG